MGTNTSAQDDHTTGITDFSVPPLGRHQWTKSQNSPNPEFSVGFYKQPVSVQNKATCFYITSPNLSQGHETVILKCSQAFHLHPSKGCVRGQPTHTRLHCRHFLQCNSRDNGIKTQLKRGPDGYFFFFFLNKCSIFKAR